MADIEKKQKFQCQTCFKYLSTNQSLMIHNRAVHENVKSKCHICDKEYTHLKGHMKYFHREAKKCDLCGKETLTLEEHFEQVHNKQMRYACGYCGKTYVTRGSLKLHLKSLHQKIRHKCKTCKKSYSTRSYLTKHIKIYHEMSTKIYKCDICTNFSCKFKEGLTRHVLDMHEKREKPKCDICGKEVRLLKSHIKQVHEKIKKYHCEVCGKKFAWPCKVKRS